ncbi:hypothetical protein [Breoghania sp.]|uniref:ABC transporter permease n=1 Tax=Breoghania sp. TaxID=2065378 RepID=UPI002AA7CEDD|nr:hypothetical protein [Breoghania sp.]
MAHFFPLGHSCAEIDQSEGAGESSGSANLSGFSDCPVVIPLALPSVISASLFSFLASFDESIITLFLTGIRTQTLPVRIRNSLLLEFEPTIAAVATFPVGIAAVAPVAGWAIRKATGNLDSRI